MGNGPVQPYVLGLVPPSRIGFDTLPIRHSRASGSLLVLRTGQLGPAGSQSAPVQNGNAGTRASEPKKIKLD